jgi:hypothetical protein
VTNHLKGTLGFQQKDVDPVLKEAEIADRAFKKFRQMQSDYSMDSQEFARPRSDKSRPTYLSGKLLKSHTSSNNPAIRLTPNAASGSSDRYR